MKLFSDTPTTDDPAWADQAAAALPRPFVEYGIATQQLPIVISVPHAGRAYPAHIESLARLPLDQLRPLEDRYVDRLIDDAIQAGASAIVANTARAWIDLNRSEREFDAATVNDAPPGQAMTSAKVRGGLGIIPWRLANGGDIWRGPLSAAEFSHRIAAHHRPYHAAVARQIERIRSRFGRVILIDLHSMPPLRHNSDTAPPNIVIGDRFGKSARHRIAEVAQGTAHRCGYRTAVNTPYAGGYILERHGAPANGVDAIQVEISRDCYLDPTLNDPGDGANDASRFIAALVFALAAEIT